MFYYLENLLPLSKCEVYYVKKNIQFNKHQHIEAKIAIEEGTKNFI